MYLAPYDTFKMTRIGLRIRFKDQCLIIVGDGGEPDEILAKILGKDLGRC